MPANGNGPDPKKRRLLPNDRQEINMLYEDVMQADIKRYGAVDDSRCISLLTYLLWQDDGYKYLGDSVDGVVRIGWLIRDFKTWTKRILTRVVTKGQTGNPHLDDVLRRTKEVRRLLKLKNHGTFPEQPSHRGVTLDQMTFAEFRQKGEEYYEEARALLRKGDYCTGVYLVGVRAGRELDSRPSSEVLEIQKELDSDDSSVDEE